MLQKEMLPTGAKRDLSKLRIPVEGFINNFPQMAWLFDVETLNFVAINKEVLDFEGFQNQQELENKNVFYLEKRNREKHSNQSITFAHKVEKELEDTLSAGVPLIFPQHSSGINSTGYCSVRSTMRVPAFDDTNKATCVLTVHEDITKREHIDALYKHYMCTYKDDMKQGNKLFMEYLGLPIYDFVLTTRQIETLIALAKNRTNINAARELDLAASTLASYISSIKNRQHNQNLNDILLHFTTNDRRIF